MRCPNCAEEVPTAEYTEHRAGSVRVFYDLWTVPGIKAPVKVYAGQAPPSTPGARWTVRGAFTTICPPIEEPAVRAEVFRFPARKETAEGRYGFIVKKGTTLLSSGQGAFGVCIAIAHAEVGRLRADEPAEPAPVQLSTGERLTYQVEDRQVRIKRHLEVVK